MELGTAPRSDRIGTGPDQRGVCCCELIVVSKAGMRTPLAFLGVALLLSGPVAAQEAGPSPTIFVPVQEVGSQVGLLVEFLLVFVLFLPC